MIIFQLYPTHILLLKLVVLVFASTYVLTYLILHMLL